MLSECALAADGAPLIGPHGELIWMCAPRWHCDAVFSALIGGNGVYAVLPPARGTCGRILLARQPDLTQPAGDH